jgi:hypothetical protein
LRHWRKGKFEAALEPQKVNCSNLNKNRSFENLLLCKFLDAGPSTSILSMGFCSAMKKVIENLSVVNRRKARKWNIYLCCYP